jgi:integrase
MRGKKTCRRTPYTYASIHAQIQVLSVALSWKCEQLDIQKTEFAFSTRMFPKGWDVSRDRRLSQQEQRQVIYHLRTSSLKAKNAYRLMLLLALETGARLQELVFAEWSEVSMERRLWLIPEIHTKCNKTRAVPLSKAALRAFKALRLLSAPESERVFHQVSTPHIVSRSFHDIFARAGLKDFRFHDLRHEAISRMVLYKRKLSVYEIMTIVGHSSLQMLNRYANLRGDEMSHKMD